MRTLNTWNHILKEWSLLNPNIKLFHRTQQTNNNKNSKPKQNMSYFQVKKFSKCMILSLVYKVPVQFTFFLRESPSKTLRTMRQAQLSGIRPRGTLTNRPVHGVTAYLLLNILIYTLASYKLISPNTQTPESIMEFSDV